MTIPLEARPTCRIPEACAYSGLKRSKLYELMDDGRLETIKIDGCKLVVVPFPAKTVVAAGQGRSGGRRMSAYPALRDAIERMRSAMAREAAGRQDEQGAAWADANDAYANRLLPCLLGGEWVQLSRRGVFKLVGLNLRPLFDHPGCFRRKGNPRAEPMGQLRDRRAPLQSRRSRPTARRVASPGRRRAGQR